MKLVVAAATAGALVAGSAAGAMATAPTAKPVKSTVVLKSVDIKRHSPINFYSVDPAATSLPSVTLTARVKDSAKPATVPTTAVVNVTLAEYSKKVRGQKVTTPVLEGPLAVPLTWQKGTKSKSFSGKFQFTGPQVTAIKAHLMANAGKSIYLCLSNADVVDTATAPVTITETWSKKVTKRLDKNGVIAVGDCVRLISKAPKTS